MKNFHPHSCPRCTKEFKETTQLLSHLKNNPNCKDESKKVIIKRERNDEMKEESEDKPKKLKVCPCLYQTTKKEGRTENLLGPDNNGIIIPIILIF